MTETEPRFVQLWREFETEVRRDGYFGRRPALESIMELMRAELRWAGLIPRDPAPITPAEITALQETADRIGVLADVAREMEGLLVAGVERRASTGARIEVDRDGATRLYNSNGDETASH